MSHTTTLAKLIDKFKLNKGPNRVLVGVEVDPEAMRMIERELLRPFPTDDPLRNGTFMGVPFTVRADLRPWQVAMIYEQKPQKDAAENERLRAKNERLREALVVTRHSCEGMVDAECHCPNTSKPCVQCELRAAIKCANAALAEDGAA